MPVIGDEITLGVANTNGVALNAKIIAGNFRVIATKDSIMNEFGLLTLDNSEGFTPNLFENNQIVYVQDDDKPYQLKTINNFQVPSGPPPFFGLNPNLPNSPSVTVWEEFTGFGSSSPGAVSDPFITNGIKINTLDEASDFPFPNDGGGTAFVINENGVANFWGDEVNNIVTFTNFNIINGPLTPDGFALKINNQGLLVLSEYVNKPTFTEGAILYEDKDFYLGAPDPFNFFNNETFNSSQFDNGDFDESTTPLIFSDNGLTDSLRELNLTTPSENANIEVQTSEMFTQTYGNTKFLLLKFNLELNTDATFTNDVTLYISTVDNFSTPEAATIIYAFNVKEGANKIMIDVRSISRIYLFWIFTIPKRSYTFSNLSLIKL